MSTKIVKCPSCSKPCTWHPLGGIQCVKCGHGCKKIPADIKAEVMALQNDGITQEKENGDFETFDLDIQEYFVEPGKQINLL